MYFSDIFLILSIWDTVTIALQLAILSTAVCFFNPYVSRSGGTIPRFSVYHQGLDLESFCSFILFIERQRRAEREGEGERIPSRLHTVSAESKAGLSPTNREVMT